METCRLSRRWFLQAGIMVAGLGLLAGCAGAPPILAPTPRTATRIGILGRGESASLRTFELQARLTELGHVEGQTLVTERRILQGFDLDGTARELASLPVALIVATGSAAALAAKRATSTIPIVMIGGADPVALGLVASLGRPGSNVTGISSRSVELSGKRIELLKDIILGLRRVAAVWNPDDPDSTVQFQASAQAAQVLGVEMHSLETRPGTQMATRVEEARQVQAQAILLLNEFGSLGPVSEFATATFTAKLPAMADDRMFTQRMIGGQMAFGPNHGQQARRGAEYAYRILRGAVPADLPVEQPSVFDLAINQAAASYIGLTIPPSVLAQATEIN